jgi:hypothetical protein
VKEEHQNATDVNLSATSRDKLAAGVLKQAAQDLRRFHGGRNKVERELYYDAYSWLISEDDVWPFSFLNVCHALNLAPENVRYELMSDVSGGTLRYLMRRCARAIRRCGLSLREFFTTEPITEAIDGVLTDPAATSAI